MGLWHHPHYRVEALGETARVPGVDVARGEKILGALSAKRWILPRHVRSAPLIALKELRHAHPDGYLERTADPEYLGRIFGLESHDVDVDRTLTAQRRQVGGTVAGAAWVTSRPGRTAFNVGGGFHHAEPESGAGFCVYNDVAIAIGSLRAGGFVAPIAIVDLDYHQGNGNIVTYAEDPTVLTYSIHGSVWTHVDAVADEQILLPSQTEDALYLATLRESLSAAFEEFEPGLIFYLAGNDVLMGDRLGDFALSREGVLERDRFVIELARRRRCPAVITLAGGYSDDAWRASTDFIRWLLTDDARISEQPNKSLGERYAEIARQLDPYELQRSSHEIVLTESDLFADLTGPHSTSTRILDYYSRHGLELAIERFGLADEIRERGFTDPHLECDPSDPNRQRIAIRATKRGAPHLLLDLILRRAVRPAPLGLDPPEELRFLYIEWMLLQNPTAEFSLRHPRWPGQEHPGLGVSENVVLMLLQAAQRLGLDGVAHHPSRYHIAFLGAGQVFFLDPEVQGRFRAIYEALQPLDLTEAAWKMERGDVRWRDGHPVSWIPEDAVVPASERLRAYLESRHYQAPCEAAAERARTRGIVVER